MRYAGGDLRILQHGEAVHKDTRSLARCITMTELVGQLCLEGTVVDPLNFLFFFINSFL